MKKTSPGLRSKMERMASKLSDSVPELMEPSPLVNPDGQPYPDIPSGIYGEIEVSPRTGQLSLRWGKMPRKLTITSVRLVKLDEHGVPYEEVPLLRVPGKSIDKGESIYFPITI